MLKEQIVKSIFLLFIPRIIKLFFLIKNKEAFIFDIDNTITETGAFLMKNGDLKKRSLVVEMCNNLEVDFEMRALINQLGKRNDVEVIFLTARSYYLYAHTLNWLKESVALKRIHLVMVKEANDKYPIVKFFSKSSRQLTLIDDLTYGHEDGKIVYHNKLIEKFIRLERVNYIDLEGINDIKNRRRCIIDFFQEESTC